jgi:RNA ligase (TIGR02306 family)
MSTLSVNILPVRELKPIEKAERLELALFEGWECVVAKGSLQVGDLVVYFPIDSLLPMELENRIFGTDAKIRLNGKKVKTVKIRGVYSQGLAVPVSKLPELEGKKAGDDVTELLGVTKWEVPEDDMPAGLNVSGRKPSHKELNRNFEKYTNLEHLRKHYAWFTPGEPVVATEKLHGTSARYANLPVEVNTLWKKVKRFFGLLPSHEFCYGSRQVQLQSRWNKKKFLYHELPGDVYTRILQDYDIPTALKPGEAVYGEIIGSGIQKGYTYGHEQGDISFYVYDVQVDGRWLDHDKIVAWCKDRGFDMVPEVYRGPFDMAALHKATKGPSTIAPEQKVREGIVLRTITEQPNPTGNGRKMSKWVSEEYLFRNEENQGTDFH